MTADSVLPVTEERDAVNSTNATNTVELGASGHLCGVASVSFWTQSRVLSGRALHCILSEVQLKEGLAGQGWLVVEVLTFKFE